MIPTIQLSDDVGRSPFWTRGMPMVYCLMNVVEGTYTLGFKEDIGRTTS